MQDKSTDGALLALRKQIIRGKLEGLAHVEALLVMRGVEMPEVRIAKKDDVARRGHMRALVFEALRDGPKSYDAIARHIANKRPEIPPQIARDRMYQCMWKLKQAGLVVQDFGPKKESKTMNATCAIKLAEVSLQQGSCYNVFPLLGVRLCNYWVNRIICLRADRSTYRKRPRAG